MRTRSTLAALAAVAVLAAPVFAAGPFAQVDAGPTSIDFRPAVSGVALTLTVSGPDGFYVQQELAAGETASFSVFDAAGGFLPSGSYTWELRAAPELSDAERAQMADLRDAGANAGALRKAGKLPTAYEPLSGAFRVEQGAIVTGGEIEPGASTPAPAGENRLAQKTQVIAMDLIVQGSECVGIDCTSSESFGFDTLRLKENNLRIKFQDTSSSGSFPTNDWELQANDSANGGENQFSIVDVDSGQKIFKAEAGAGNNALVVDSTGRVGIDTASPAVKLHMVDGNTPALRLEQDGSAGFTAQTWDVAGNEANFFVRDITNGSRLPFRIEPGAAESSIHIDSDSDVGMGTSSPGSTDGTGGVQAQLHVKTSRTDGGAILVENASTTVAQRVLFELKNNGNVDFALVNSSTSDDWRFQNQDGDFRITKAGTGVAEAILDASGNLTIQGMLNTGSSREIKHGFEPVDGRDVLSRVTEMPLVTWIYNGDTSRHIGPMAEEFYAAFELGPDDKHIAPSDKAGVALAAIQGLNQVVEEKDQQIEALRTELEELRNLVRELAERELAP